MKYTANTNRICEELSLSTYDEWHDAHWSFKPSEARALARAKLVTGFKIRKPAGAMASRLLSLAEMD